MSFCQTYRVCDLLSSGCRILVPSCWWVRVVQRLVLLSSWYGVWLVLCWSEPNLGIEQGLPLAIWLMVPCQGWGLLPDQWSPTDLFISCISYLQCEADGVGTFPLGVKLLDILPLELLIFGCTLLCHLSPVVQASRLCWCWHYSQPHLNCGFVGNCPCCLSDIAFTRPAEYIHWSQVPSL